MTDWITNSFNTINQYRIQHDKKPLEISKKLTEEALKHCQNQSAIDEMFHSCKKNQLQCCAVGYKNLIEKPHKLIQMWYNHEGHKRVLLDDKMSYVGLNFYNDLSGKMFFFTATFE